MIRTSALRIKNGRNVVVSFRIEPEGDYIYLAPSEECELTTPAEPFLEVHLVFEKDTVVALYTDAAKVVMKDGVDVS